MEKEVSRGYVKWTDEDGVFHKEPLYDHPELLAKATPEEQLAAEEARRLNAAAEDYYENREDTSEQDAKDTLAALKKAPEDVLTSADLVASEETVVASGAEENGETSRETEIMKGSANDDPATADAAHDEALAELRERTTE